MGKNSFSFLLLFISLYLYPMQEPQSITTINQRINQDQELAYFNTSSFLPQLLLNFYTVKQQSFEKKINSLKKIDAYIPEKDNKTEMYRQLLETNNIVFTIHNELIDDICGFYNSVTGQSIQKITEQTTLQSIPPSIRELLEENAQKKFILDSPWYHTFTLTGHEDDVTTISYAPDNTVLASGSYDKTVKLWDVKKTSILHTLKKHKNGIHQVAFSKLGTHLTSSSCDGTLCIWDIQAGQCVHELHHHNSMGHIISCLEKEIISIDQCGTLFTWDLKSGKCINRREGYIFLFPYPQDEAISFSDDKTECAVAEEKNIHIYSRCLPIALTSQAIKNSNTQESLEELFKSEVVESLPGESKFTMHQKILEKLDFLKNKFESNKDRSYCPILKQALIVSSFSIPTLLLLSQLYNV